MKFDLTLKFRNALTPWFGAWIGESPSWGFREAQGGMGMQRYRHLENEHCLRALEVDRDDSIPSMSKHLMVRGSARVALEDLELMESDSSADSEDLVGVGGRGKRETIPAVVEFANELSHSGIFAT